jgi:gamma-glutamylcyclotransferase
MAPTLYFAYGSNLWLDQMARRCPGSAFVGVAALKDWKWFICTRGYANIIPSPGDVVYGMVYTITPANEESLDGYEGVPYSYVKQMHGVEMGGSVVEALVYVDVVRLEPGNIKVEYITRMGHAIADALGKGFPEWYVEKYIKPAL